jgi:hypothetical protein
MAISDDTVALVAAQLTQAWATIFAEREGAGGLLDSEVAGKVAGVYGDFCLAVREVPLRLPVDYSKIIE